MAPLYSFRKQLPDSSIRDFGLKANFLFSPASLPRYEERNSYDSFRPWEQTQWRLPRWMGLYIKSYLFPINLPCFHISGLVYWCVAMDTTLEGQMFLPAPCVLTSMNAFRNLSTCGTSISDRSSWFLTSGYVVQKNKWSRVKWLRVE